MNRKRFTRCKKFKVGDVICHSRNKEIGLMLFFTATEYDVEHYSGKNGWYYKEKNDKSK